MIFKRMCAWCLVAVLGVGSACALGQVIEDQPGTVRATLGNGLEVVVVPSPSAAPDSVPDSDVQVWLVVRAGSMFEADDQRGVAMVYQRVVLGGTNEYSREAIDELLALRDVGYGREVGGFVSFDQATFLGRAEMGQGRGDDSQWLGAVLGFYRQVLDGRSVKIDAHRVDRAVDELIEEREGDDAEMRSRLRWFSELFAGSLFGQRFPSASIDELRRVKPDAVRAFAQAHYRPAQATVIVVGVAGAGQAAAVLGEIRSVLGLIEQRGQAQYLDARLGVDLSMRAVFDREPGLEQDQGAMVWFRDRAGDGVLGAWNDRARAYRSEAMRATVISRVAGEVVRYRLGRQGALVLGAQAQIGVEQVELFGQVELFQVGIELEADVDADVEGWNDAIGFLVHQCDRLNRDGVSSEEIGRARRSLLARWHRDADDSVGMDAQGRMGLVHWLVTTGRPMIDMVRWDALATEMMSTIRDEEIEEAVREMVDPMRASYIALERGEGADESGENRDERVLAVVRRAMDEPIDGIDPGWMNRLVDSLIDDEPEGGMIDEVIEHGASGVWSARLGNGVWVRARAMAGDGDDRVYLSATLGGTMLDEGGRREDEIRAALIAWQSPATERRGGAAVGVFVSEHDLEIRVRREDGFVQLMVSGPAQRAGEAMELMYVLLDQPLIEERAFEAWQGRDDESAIDPIDEGLGVLYRDGYGVGARGARHRAVTLDGAQRLLTQIVRNAQIEIGIAGAVDAQAMIERGGELFGALVDRPAGDDRGHEEVGSGGITSERVARVQASDKDEHGVAIGYLGDPDAELATIRAMILASMVLSDRLKARAQDQGFDGRVRAHIWSSGMLHQRDFLLARASCADDAREDAQRLIDETIEGMVREGITPGELEGVQDRLDASIGRYFDKPNFWSLRLSTLWLDGRRVDELWTIRQGYRGIDLGMVNEVFGALIAGNERFVIEIVGTE